MKVKNCHNCGAKLEDDKLYCPYCGTANNFEEEIEYEKANNSTEQKSKLAAGLLGIFLGGLGIHNFYLGYTTKGVIQLLLSTIGWAVLVGPFVAHIWGFIEGIMIIAGSISEDANGVKLRD